MEKIKEFLSWFYRMGGTTNDYYDHVLESRLRTIPIREDSSLKGRAQEIKEKYNHVFETKKINEDILKDIPDISTLKFKRKK